MGKRRISRPRLLQRTCRECGARFNAKGATAKCDNCAACLYCGKRVTLNRNRYCSISCKFAHGELAYSSTCKQCGRQFKGKGPTSQRCPACCKCARCGESLTNPSRKFCSTRCAPHFDSSNQSQWEQTCRECGARFAVTGGASPRCPDCAKCKQCGARLRHIQRQFCGASCFGKWNAANNPAFSKSLPHRTKGWQNPRKGVPNQKLRGERHYNWKGGDSETYRHARSREMCQVEYKLWRATVFKRDHHACVICGAQRPLQAHHIHSYRNHPELRLDTRNGVTLCVACHRGIRNREALFVTRFEAYVASAEPVTLTEDERSRFLSDV